MVRTISIFLSILMLSSCVVMREEGDQMQRDLQNLRNDMSQVQKLHQESFARVKTLEDEVFQKLKLNAASETDNERLREELERIKGQLEETQHRIEQLDQGSGAGAQPAAVPVASQAEYPLDKQGHYDAAKQMFDKQDYVGAAASFDAFSRRHADSNLIDAAYFWKGESYYQLAKRAIGDAEQQDDYKKAVLAYQQLLSQYPKSQKTDEALYKVGLSLEAMGLNDDAKLFYEEIVKKHKKSSRVDLAKKRLQVLADKPKMKSKKKR